MRAMMWSPDPADTSSGSAKTHGTSAPANKTDPEHLGGAGDVEDARGRAAAGGNTVTNTGRPTGVDAPSGIGAAAISGAMQSGQEDNRDWQHHQPDPNTRRGDRPTDVVEGRAGGPEGNLSGQAPDDDAQGGISAANPQQVQQDDDQEWRRAGGKSPG